MDIMDIKDKKSLIHGRLDFSRATFEKYSDFSGAVFLAKLYFFDTVFEQEAVFYGALFITETDLRRTKYSILRIHWGQLKGLLDWPLSEILHDFSEDIETKSQYIKLQEWKATYLELIKNFKNLGDTETADEVYYHYRSKKPIFKTEGNMLLKPGWWQKKHRK